MRCRRTVLEIRRDRFEGLSSMDSQWIPTRQPFKTPQPVVESRVSREQCSENETHQDPRCSLANSARPSSWFLGIIRQYPSSNRTKDMCRCVSRNRDLFYRIKGGLSRWSVAMH